MWPRRRRTRAPPPTLTTQDKQQLLASTARRGSAMRRHRAMRAASMFIEPATDAAAEGEGSGHGNTSAMPLATETDHAEGSDAWFDDLLQVRGARGIHLISACLSMPKYVRTCAGPVRAARARHLVLTAAAGGGCDAAVRWWLGARLVSARWHCAAAAAFRVQLCCSVGALSLAQRHETVQRPA